MKVSEELEFAIMTVLKLEMFYEEHDKHHLAMFAVNARHQLEAARHIERIRKDD